MKKIAYLGFLLLIFPQQPVLSQQQLDGRQLLKSLKEANGRIMETRIELGEALINHLEKEANYVESERLKAIYRLATEYQNFFDSEQRVLLMYTHIKEAVKVYLSAHSRDIVIKKKIDWDESLNNIQKYSSDLIDRDIIMIVNKLLNRLRMAQDIIEKLIQFYSSENAKYRLGEYNG